MIENNIWGTDTETLEGVVAQLIISTGKSLAVAETITGGLLSLTLANEPNSARFFNGGIIANNPGNKINSYG